MKAGLPYGSTWYRDNVMPMAFRRGTFRCNSVGVQTVLHPILMDRNVVTDRYHDHHHHHHGHFPKPSCRPSERAIDCVLTLFHERSLLE